MRKLLRYNYLKLKANLPLNLLRLSIVMIGFHIPFLSTAQVNPIDSITNLLKSNLSNDAKKGAFYNYVRKKFVKDSLATITFANEAKKTALKFGTKIFSPIAELTLGDAYMFVKNQGTAFSVYKSCYLLSEEFNDTIIALNAAQNLNYFYRLYGDHELAIKYCLKALKLSEIKKSSRGISINSMNLGHSLKKMKRFKDALEYYKKAYYFAVLDSNTTMIPNSLTSIGNAFKESGIKDSALFYYLEARAFCEKHKTEKSALATALSNIGDYYYENQILDSAIANYEVSLKLAREITNPSVIAHSLVNLASIFSIQKKYLESTDSLLVALKIAEREKLLEPQINIYKRLAENYTKQQDFIEANKCLQSAQIYIDSVYNIESLKIVNGLQIIYEVEKKENEILTLNTLNAEEKQQYLTLKIQKDSIFYKLLIKSREEKLSKAQAQLLYQEKERLMLEKKANLASISNLGLTIETANLKAISDSLATNQKILELEKSKAIKQRTITLFIAILCISILSSFLFILRNRIRIKNVKIKLIDSELKIGRLQIKPHTIMSFVRAIEEEMDKKESMAKSYISKLQSLLSDVLSYSELNQITLSKEIKLLKDYMDLEKLRKNNFDYTLELSPNIEEDSILVLPIIILPFVENSIYHGFSFPSEENRGMIVISIEEKGNQILISVTDNGIGRKNATLASPKSSRQSMGMKITRERIMRYNSKNNTPTDYAEEDLNIGLEIKFNLYKENAY